MWHKFFGRVSIEIGHKLVQKRPDDQYIVSYPRSGNTWIRTILVNLLVPEASSNPDVFNRRLPGVSIRRSRWINGLPSPRLIKSHTWYRSDISRGIYLVRDGRDALVSFYYYNTSRRGNYKPFPVFFREYVRGSYGHRWDEHVLSWLQIGKEKMGDNLHIVQFERLKQDTPKVIAEVLAFLKLEFSPLSIHDAVQSTSLQNMRQIEQQRREVDISDPNASFYRGGKQGEWSTLFTTEIHDEFINLSAAAMKMAGYNV